MRRARWVPLVLVAVQLGAVIGAFWLRPAWLLAMFSWFAGLGTALGALLYVLLYVFSTVFFLPGFLLTLGAGFLFGLAGGAVVVSIGSTIGAILSFSISRSWGRALVAREIAGTPSYIAIDRAITHDSFKTVLLLRLSPLLPFNLLNYTLGLTGVDPRRYALGSWLGMIPGTLLYVYLGTLAATAAELLDDSPAGRSPGQIAMLGTGFVATVLATGLITRRARAELARMGEAGEAG
jgi:uncharacterized membrane protein YdjX (TVP38/TMEM64 family)